MPYTRPPLTKEFLRARDQVVDDHLLPAEPDATWLLGDRATVLDPVARRVTLSDHGELGYERLIIATGCRSRPWPGPGAELSGVHTIRSADDALALRDALVPGVRVAIVGAGFIGSEVAASVRVCGYDVALFDIADTPMTALGPDLGRRCADLQRSHGAELHMGAAIVALRGHGGRFHAIETADGTLHEADLVVIALGAIPCTEWLAGSGITAAGQLRCDATLTVPSAPDVLAAGDVASWPYAPTGDHVRVEHWTNAAEQGALTGRNALVEPGERGVYSGIPSFWSDQYDTKVQAIGLSHLATSHHVIEESADGDRLLSVALRDGVLVGVAGFNAARRLPHYRGRLGQPFEVEAQQRALADDPKALGVPMAKLT